MSGYQTLFEIRTISQPEAFRKRRNPDVWFSDVYCISFNISRGWLVQWKNVRLSIQRSGFASRLRQMVFLSRRGRKNARLRSIELLPAEKSENAIYWNEKRSSILTLYEERNVPSKNWSYDVSILGSGMTSVIFYYAILQQIYTSNLLQYQPTRLTKRRIARR